MLRSPLGPVSLRRRISDLTGSGQLRPAKQSRSVTDPMKAAATRRRIEAKATAVAEAEELKRAVRERDPSRTDRKRSGWRKALPLRTRGFDGRGGGRMSVVDRPASFRATTDQACGPWPFYVGTGHPQSGTPLGVDPDSGQAVCYDPVSAVYRSPRQQNTPSLFILGLPSLGKSTVARILVAGAIAQGQIPIIPADLKPDEAALVGYYGGLVIRLGHGEGYLNPLAVGALGSILPLLDEFPDVQRKVAAQVLQRRRRLVSGLCELERGGPLTQSESNVLAVALRVLDADPRFTPEHPPLLSDLFTLIEKGSPELARKTISVDDPDKYAAKVEGLLETLIGLLDGELGEVFSRQTTVPLDLAGERPPVAVCVDVSSIGTEDPTLEAAIMLACWSDAFGAVEAAHVLADVGLREKRTFLVVLDELWRVLAGGSQMVLRVDQLTRLTRTMGTALLMITHTVADLETLATAVDISRAKGFIERAGAVIVGGLPTQEMGKLDGIIPFTQQDRDLVSSWSTPAGIDDTGRELPPPGRGKFLLRIGTARRPGVVLQTVITATEAAAGYHDTNARFAHVGGGGGGR
ncbi:hypothetical protein [Rhodococcus sp. NBC_00294]|uniref:hypothetical protein n=1 Tax=Rhodococcus sp. NBC_00294 TaxID=2976004 RepID=UPI002E2C5646|nr:hypothetical protein [Rhodococcus sp. NBC_00294]